MRLLVSLLMLLGAVAHAEPDTTKPWTYWWWLGSAVNEADITWQLETFAKAGLGGVHMIPIYGVKGFDDLEVPHLSPRWAVLFAHTVKEAERLGLGVDMTLGTGWPYGGPHVDERIAALKAEFERQKVRAGKSPRALHDVERLIALRAFRDGEEPLDLLVHMEESGEVDWTADDGTWEVVAVYQTPTGQQVKRAAPGAKGHVLDPYSETALDAHLAHFEEPLGDALNELRGVYNDSFEVYGANWTPGFFDIFAERRGYDLRDHLLALVGTGDEDEGRRVRHDYRQTVAECLLDDFTKPWRAWADGRGLQTRLQAHGSPGNLLDLYAAASIPETEHFGPEGVDTLFWKFASSAAHTGGHNLVASESCTWLDEHFTVTLAQVKDAVDHLWLAGINHVFFHGTPYSPPDAPWPGWQFYASTWFGPANPFYRDFPALTEYIKTVQTALQEGEPDNDILLYFPMDDYWMTDVSVRDMLQPLTAHNSEEWLKGRPVGMTARILQDRGYTFDYVSDAQLGEAEFEEGEIRLGQGRYVTVIVPACEYIPVDTMAQLHRLAEAGATILFQGEGPRDVPGWHDVEARRQSLREFTALLEGVRDSEGGLHVAVGDGQWVRGGKLEGLLAKVGAIRETMVDDGLAFVRRRVGEGVTYFVKNATEKEFIGPIKLARNEAIKYWEKSYNFPLDIHDASCRNDSVRLDPGETILQPAAGSFFARERMMISSGFDMVMRHSGSLSHTPLSIEGPWSLTFVSGGPSLPNSIEMEVTNPWTSLDLEGGSCFSGTARYTTEIKNPGEAFRLTVADVGDSARVFVNGIDLGARIAPPYKWDVEEHWVGHDLTTESKLTITIEVTNVGANRIRWMDQQGIEWRIFKDINFVNINYKPFDASDWPVRPAGILGPVTITPLEPWEPEAVE